MGICLFGKIAKMNSKILSSRLCTYVKNVNGKQGLLQRSSKRNVAQRRTLMTSPFKNMPDSYRGPIVGAAIGGGLFAFTLKYCSDMVQRMHDLEDGTFNPKLHKTYTQEEFQQFKFMMTGETPEDDDEEDEDDDDDEEDEDGEEVEEAAEEEAAEEEVVEEEAAEEEAAEEVAAEEVVEEAVAEEAAVEQAVVEEVAVDEVADEVAEEVAVDEVVEEVAVEELMMMEVAAPDTKTYGKDKVIFI